MTNKELITAGCVVGGLVGLGILAYMMLREDEEKIERALNDPDLSEGYRKRQQASFQVDPADSLDEEDMVEEEPDPHMGIELTPLEHRVKNRWRLPRNWTSNPQRPRSYLPKGTNSPCGWVVKAIALKGSRCS